MQLLHLILNPFLIDLFVKRLNVLPWFKEFEEVCSLIRPADEVALFKVKCHAFDPLADPLELVVAIPGVKSLLFDHSNWCWVAFWVQTDGPSRLIRTVNTQLNDEASFNTCRYQLLGLWYEDALLDEPHAEWKLFDTVQILIKDQYLEVLGACEV